MFSSVKGSNSLCPADVGPVFVLAPGAPVQIWRRVGVEGGGLREREGPSETRRTVLQPPLVSELPGGFDAITVSWS